MICIQLIQMIRTQCIALFHTTSIFTRSITSSGLICARKVCLVEKVVESLKKNHCIATNGNILGTNVKGNTKKYSSFLSPKFVNTMP